MDTYQTLCLLQLFSILIHPHRPPPQPALSGGGARPETMRGREGKGEGQRKGEWEATGAQREGEKPREGHDRILSDGCKEKQCVERKM